MFTIRVVCVSEKEIRKKRRRAFITQCSAVLFSSNQHGKLTFMYECLTVTHLSFSFTLSSCVSVCVSEFSCLLDQHTTADEKRALKHPLSSIFLFYHTVLPPLSSHACVPLLMSIFELTVRLCTRLSLSQTQSHVYYCKFEQLSHHEPAVLANYQIKWMSIWMITPT